MIENSVVFANRKGGVGKTSTSAHFAASLARADWKVLVVDLDPQGDLGRDLGYIEHEDNDEGAMLHDAVNDHTPLLAAPLHLDRLNLDAVPGGAWTEELGRLINRLEVRFPALCVEEALKEIAEDYDMVVIDAPPAAGLLQDAALAAGHYVVGTTKDDSGSYSGVRELLERIRQANEQINPELTLIGVVLFDIESNASQIRKQAQGAVAKVLSDSKSDARVFKSIIRHLSEGRLLRERGLTVFEREDQLLSEQIQRDKNRQDRDEARKKKGLLERMGMRKAEEESKPTDDEGISPSPEESLLKLQRGIHGLARDYASLTTEILRSFNDHRNKKVVDVRTSTGVDVEEAAETEVMEESK